MDETTLRLVEEAVASRAKRIMEAANGFWSSLDDDQRGAVGEAWDERVELPSRWPPPPS